MTIGFTGHQDIPPEAYGFVKAGIAAELLREGGQVTGVCSLAAGADQLFARTVLARQGALHAVIPSEGYESTFSGDDLERFQELLGNASEVETLPFPKPSQDAYLAAGKRVADRSQRMVAVWDGQDAQGLGGTGDIVRYAEERDVPVTIVWPEGVERGETADNGEPADITHIFPGQLGLPRDMTKGELEEFVSWLSDDLSENGFGTARLVNRKAHQKGLLDLNAVDIGTIAYIAWDKRANLRRLVESADRWLRTKAKDTGAIEQAKKLADFFDRERD